MKEKCFCLVVGIVNKIYMYKYKYLYLYVFVLLTNCAVECGIFSCVWKTEGCSILKCTVVLSNL